MTSALSLGSPAQETVVTKVATQAQSRKPTDKEVAILLRFEVFKQNCTDIRLYLIAESRQIGGYLDVSSILSTIKAHRAHQKTYSQPLIRMIFIERTKDTIPPKLLENQTFFNSNRQTINDFLIQNKIKEAKDMLARLPACMEKSMIYALREGNVVFATHLLRSPNFTFSQMSFIAYFLKKTDPQTFEQLFLRACKDGNEHIVTLLTSLSILDGAWVLEGARIAIAQNKLKIVALIWRMVPHYKMAEMIDALCKNGSIEDIEKAINTRSLIEMEKDSPINLVTISESFMVAAVKYQRMDIIELYLGSDTEFYAELLVESAKLGLHDFYKKLEALRPISWPILIAKIVRSKVDLRFFFDACSSTPLKDIPDIQSILSNLIIEITTDQKEIPYESPSFKRATSLLSML